MHDLSMILVEPGNVGEGCVQHDDPFFEFASDSAASGVQEHVRGPGAFQRSVLHSLSDSNAPLWITTTIERIDLPLLGVAAEGPDVLLSEREARFLQQVDEDLEELCESVRLSASAKLCKQFTDSVGLDLANIPRVRCAVFGAEEDGVTLVAHSRASMRQVSFEFGDDEKSINIISIDEQMRRFERACGIDQALTLAKAIEWLNLR